MKRHNSPIFLLVSSRMILLGLASNEPNWVSEEYSDADKNKLIAVISM